MEKSPFVDLASRPQYKPFATRSPVLIFLLLLTLSFIALTEFACRIIPLHTGVGKLGNVMSKTLKIELPSDLNKRQSDASYTPRTDAPVPSETTTYPVYSTPGAGGYLSLGDDAPPSITVAPNSGYLSVGGGPIPTPTAPPDAPPSIYTPDSASVYTPGGGYSPARDGSIYSTILATPASGYLEIGDGSSTINNPADPTPDGSNPTDIGFIPGTAVVSDGVTMTVTPATPTPFLVVENGVTLMQTPLITSTPASGYLKPTPTPGAPNSGYLKATSSAPPPPSETVINSTGTYFVYEDGQSIIAPQITLKQYLLVSFVPIIIAALFTIPWRIVDTTIREMEPFYQLHQEGGARAEHSLCLDYSTSLLFTTPFKSLFRGHFYVFWSSLISVAVLGLAPLSSEAFFVSLTGQCGPNMPPCRATWGIYILLARVIEGILAFIAVLVAFLILFGFRRKSGVYSEPFSIAGLAALFHNSPLLRGFREVDSRVDNKQLKEILAGKRYGISGFTTFGGRPGYGILPADPDSEAGFPSIARVGKKGQYHLVDGAEVPRNAYGKPIKGEELEVKTGIWTKIKAHLLYSSTCFIITGLLALITYYHWSSAENGFEWFMDSQGFGVRFMMAGIGVLLKSLWSTIDQDLRKMEPYHRLLLGGSKPEDSILVPVWMGPFSALLPSLRRRHFLISLICFVTILSEFLPIALTNISFSPAMTKEAYEGCTYVSMAVLIIMLFSILILMFRPRHSVRPLPRKPTTVAAILLYITSNDEHGEGFLDSFEGLSGMGTRERNAFVKGLGNLYTLGIGASNDLRIVEDRHIKRLWAD